MQQLEPLRRLSSLLRLPLRRLSSLLRLIDTVRLQDRTGLSAMLFIFAWHRAVQDLVLCTFCQVFCLCRSLETFTSMRSPALRTGTLVELHVRIHLSVRLIRPDRIGLTDQSYNSESIRPSYQTGPDRTDSHRQARQTYLLTYLLACLLACLLAF